jgi:hypothetical protein
MKKKIIITVLLLTDIIAGYFVYKNIAVRYEEDIGLINYNQPKCSFASSTIGVYKYAFSTNQDGMEVYTYATNGIKGGDGFNFGQKTSPNESTIKDFYDNFINGANEFNTKYPNESKGSGICAIAGITGYCGLYQGNLGLFAWKDAHSYNVINNFRFDKTELEPIVIYFNNCPKF